MPAVAGRTDGKLPPTKARSMTSRCSEGFLVRWCATFVVALLVGAGAVPAAAGGGPENVFLVVNASSPASIEIGNAYIALRNIPPINVFMLPWEGSREAIPIAEFRDTLLSPILQAIDGRRLSSQIDHVVYSSDFPWRIDFEAELPAALVGQDHYPSASLTGLTMQYMAVLSRRPSFLEVGNNAYWRPLDDDGVPRETHGFRSWYGWGAAGEVLDAGGPRYLLATMLGVTQGRGNSVAEIIASLASAVEADGKRPLGTIYFATNKDVRTTTRSGGFPPIVRELGRLGIKAKVFEGTLPKNERDVAGLMTGSADFDWTKSGSTITPGAICENLTSFGAIFSKNAGQTPLSAFIRAGAGGTSGTVTEPYALQDKFPHPAIQVHYARGASLAEAFYQSVRAPYQLLVVGDPLCQPWALIPEIEAYTLPEATQLEPGRVLSGKVEIEARGRIPGEAANGGADAKPAVDRFEFFIDGVRSGQCVAGERYDIETKILADGYHEMRVVGIVSSTVETQGRLVIPFSTANHGRTLALGVHPETVKADGKVRVSVAGKGLEGVTVFCNGRVIGRTAGAEATVEVPADVLGVGRVTIRATGRAGFGTTNMVNATPVTVDVRPAN